MLVKILKPFPYSEDGIHSRDLDADTVEDIRDDLIIGLMEEGYVGDAEAADLTAADNAPSAGPAQDESPAAEPDGDPTEVGEGDQTGDGSGQALPPIEPGVIAIVTNLDGSPVAMPADGSLLPGEPAKGDAFDHDGDGFAGGSLPKAKRRKRPSVAP